MGTIAKVLVILVLFAAFGLFVAFMCVLIEGSLLEIRRRILILIWGYGGDIACWFYAVVSGVVAGIKSLFHHDESVEEALDL